MTLAHRPGAVLATDGPDAGAVLHFGSPLAEQRALDEGRAIADLSARTIIELAGPDRLTWINTITSGLVSELTPGESTETLFLDPQGHIEYAVGLVDDGASLWMFAETSTAPGLLAWLLKMRFRSDVQITDRTGELARIGFVERPGHDLIAELDVHAPNGMPVIWRDPWVGISAGGWQYSHEARHPGTVLPWAEALVPADAVAALTTPAAGVLSAEALRISAWRPRQAAEVDEKSIPHESDWLRTAVHLNKGCYRGQETIAKVHNLGHPPRRLVFLDLDGSTGSLPAPGAEVRAYKGDEPRVVGTVTSVALHHEEGPIALALIKRAVPEDARIEVALDEAWIAANQTIIVPGDAGATAGVPRLPRIGSTRR